MPPLVGHPAPDFTLASTAGADVSLSDFRGRAQVLLAFFPEAFTSVCTTEMCAFTEDYDRFAATGTVILPISVDPVETLRRFKAAEHLAVDLLSDITGEVSRAWGTLYEDSRVSNRAYFLVDRDGVLRWSHVEPHPGTRRSDDELLAAITALGG